MLNAFSLQSSPDAFSLSPVAERLTTAVNSLSGNSYSSICYVPGLNASSVPCFTSVSSSTVTLSFAPGAREDWVNALKRMTALTVNGTRYEIQNPKRIQSIGEMKSSKWVAYALWALVMRFWDLASKADSLDIFVVLLGYVLMHGTFLRLFWKSRALGSNFWLSAGIMMSSVFAFLFTLPLCRALDIPLDPICLSEALPFLVCTVGFEKPLRLAREVLAHPQALKPQEDGRMKPAGDVILEALDKTGNYILRDYALEVAVLLIGANSKVGGLREFCALASIAMVLDCVMLGTFYSAVLTIMLEVSGNSDAARKGSRLARPRAQAPVGAPFPIRPDQLSAQTSTDDVPGQVRRIKMVRSFRRSSSSAIKSSLSRSANKAAPAPAQPKSLRERISSALIGVKGASLNASQEFEVNPMARLKLLIVRDNTLYAVVSF